MDAILNFLREAPLAKLLIFAGICAVWVGIQGTIRYWIILGKVVRKKLEKIERISSVVFGVMLILAALAIHLNVTLVPEDFVRGYVGPALIILFGLLAILGSIRAANQLRGIKLACDQLDLQTKTIAEAAKGEIQKEMRVLVSETTLEFKKHTEQLEKAEKHLVAHVEDATRRVLEGIPEIFQRAYKLVQEADGEIWLVNFALEFGKVHCANQGVVDKYKHLYDRDFESDVTEFYNTLQLRVLALPTVHILTISDDGASKNFLEPLKERKAYEKLEFSKTLDDLRNAKQYFTNEIAGVRKKAWKGAHSYRCCELHSLPIQLLIAGIKPEKGETDKRFGCLVFMVGSDSLSGLQTGEESGFYTELEPMVIVMKNLASALMKGATLLYDESGKHNTNIRRVS